MTLFEADENQNPRDFTQVAADAPLAARARPERLDELVGQKHLLAEGSPLRASIERDELFSFIMYGPAGSGKTTLASLIARTTRHHFETLSAVTASVKDLRRIGEQARERRRATGRRTVLFVDEIHRFNKAQQDSFLPFVESGDLLLIGATTENPFFELNSPLLSRAPVFQFEPLTEDDLYELLERAVERNLLTPDEKPFKADPEALRLIAQQAAGDARFALNALEMASQFAIFREAALLELEDAQKALSKQRLPYDKSGDEHYNLASAFIKSLRGSDPDAALYYMARMMEAGEEVRFIARRLVISAAEDVGLADPVALLVANAAAQAVDFVGWPEARILLAEAAVYICNAEKSNSACVGIDNALAAVRAGITGQAPRSLRDSSYPGAAKLGAGKGYLYPHDFPGAFVKQQYLPEDVGEVSFYIPKLLGQERKMAERLVQRWGDRYRPADSGEKEEQ